MAATAAVAVVRQEKHDEYAMTVGGISEVEIIYLIDWFASFPVKKIFYRFSKQRSEKVDVSSQHVPEEKDEQTKDDAKKAKQRNKQ